MSITWGAFAGLIQAGGVLTSLYNTSQQWDAPNAWPPLQYFVVEGLQTYGGGRLLLMPAYIHAISLIFSLSSFILTGDENGKG